VTDPRRASDDLLIQLVREGRHDAEIAVRLGITTGELRERKAQLRGKLGDERYIAVTGQPSRKQPGKRRFFLWGMGIAAASLAALLGIANFCAGADDSSEANVRVLPTPTIHPPLRPPQVETIDGVAFDDAGQAFSVGGKSTADVGVAENRAAVAVLKFNGTGYLSPTEFADWTAAGTNRSSFQAKARLGERVIILTLYLDNTGTNLRPLATGVGPILEISGTTSATTPTVLITAFSDQRDQYQVRVTNQGKLSISRTPIPADWVIDEFTGARLDVSGAVALGKLPGRLQRLTACDQGTGSVSCAGIINSGSVRAPSDGSVTCRDTGETVFTSGGSQVVFNSRNGRPSCSAHDLRSGDEIVPSGQWRLQGVDSVGHATSAAIARDGTVYVGQVQGRVLCPCLPGT
jgi:hypothetical protein